MSFYDIKKFIIRDIENITFSEDIREITSSMEVISTFLKVHNDTEVQKACTKKLNEGIQILRKLNAHHIIKQFQL